MFRAAPCPACIALGEGEHSRAGEHLLTEYREVATALGVGTVFCSIPELDKKAKLVVRGARKDDKGQLEVEVLEGWFPSRKVWMKARRRAA